MQSLSLTERAGGVDDCLGDSLAVNYDLLDKTGCIERLDELKCRTRNCLLPAGTARQVDSVAADRRTYYAASRLHSSAADRIFETAAI